jgi:predicted O-methyltransferase YrrM
MASITFNTKNITGHEVLAAAGKKILRPGGRVATEQLLQWAEFKPGDTVLELASSFGYSAIALAKRYNVRVVGIEKKPESVARARANIAAAGLANQVEIIQGDIFHLEKITEQFDYILAEAILTMQSIPAKAKLFSMICARLKPGGKFLSHELLASHHEAEIHKALAQVIRVNSTPLSEFDWILLCENAGLQVQQHQTGAMELLNPRRIIEDEGILDTVRFLWNILRYPQLRERILAMRQVFQQYQQDLGYILICATRV